MRHLIAMALVTLAVRILPGTNKRAAFAFSSSLAIIRLER